MRLRSEMAINWRAQRSAPQRCSHAMRALYRPHNPLTRKARRTTGDDYVTMLHAHRGVREFAYSPIAHESHVAGRRVNCTTNPRRKHATCSRNTQAAAEDISACALRLSCAAKLAASSAWLARGRYRGLCTCMKVGSNVARPPPSRGMSTPILAHISLPRVKSKPSADILAGRRV